VSRAVGGLAREVHCGLVARRDLPDADRDGAAVLPPWRKKQYTYRHCVFGMCACGGIDFKVGRGMVWCGTERSILPMNL